MFEIVFFVVVLQLVLMFCIFYELCDLSHPFDLGDTQGSRLVASICQELGSDYWTFFSSVLFNTFNFKPLFSHEFTK